MRDKLLSSIDVTEPVRNTSRGVSRRQILVSATAAASALTAGALQAQAAWPTRPIKIIDVFTPGGSADILARALAAKMAPRLGQPVSVENRPGGGGAIGLESVARSAPDGHTLLLGSTSNVVLEAASTTGRKLPFDFLKDFTPIGEIGTSPLVIVVPADSPIKTLRDLVERARAKPNDGIRYGSSGVGSMSHIGMEMLASAANVQLMHVPYRSNALAITDLLGGQLQALLSSVATSLSLLESGKLRAIVVTGQKRSPFLPNVPTSAEAGYPSYLIEFSWSLMGPAGMAPDLVRRLNGELNQYLGQADIRDLLARSAAVARPGTPEDLGRSNATEVARWAKLIKDANIKME